MGHFTSRGFDKGWLIRVSQINADRQCDLGAECHFERCVIFAGHQLAVFLLLHQADDHQQAVAADFRCEVQAVVNAQTQQLKVAALGQILLKLTACGHDLLGAARFAQHFQHELNRHGQRRKVLRPLVQIGLACRRRVVLPSMVSRQVKLARAARNGAAAANAVQEFVFAERAAHFADHGVERFKALVQLLNDEVEGFFRNGRVAAVGVELLFVTLDVFQNFRFEFRA